MSEENCQECTITCQGCHESKKSGCPSCGGKGMNVKYETVKGLSITYIQNQIEQHKEEPFYLCTSKTCKTGYFTLTGVNISLNLLEVPIWFKQNKQEYYVCYCRRITLDEVVMAVNRIDHPTIESIIHFLNRDRVLTKCLNNNPTGQSCKPLFENAIKYGVNKKIKKV